MSHCTTVVAFLVAITTCILYQATASESYPLIPRSVHAFMYLWYGEPTTDGVYRHWNHEILPHWESRINQLYPDVGKRFNPPLDVHSPYYPLHGPYSSLSKEVLQRQFLDMASAGIEVAVVSWWGQRDKPYATDTQGVNTDKALAVLLEEADVFNSARLADEEGSSLSLSIKIALHLEPYPGRSVESIADDLQYLHTNYGHHACIYRGTDGRPVHYVYDSYHILSNNWARLLDRQGDLSIRGTQTDAIMIGLWLDHHHGRDLREGKFDGFYTYFGSDGFSYGSTSSNWGAMCSNARRAKMLCCISVGPGYNDTLIRPWNDRNTRSRNKGKYYEDMWRRAVRADPHSISITSYNEWGEGTQIEPARSFHLRTHKRERATHEPSNQRQSASVTAEQLRHGVIMEQIAAGLEDLQSWEGVELYSTPFAEQMIGVKAAGLREDARPIVQTGGTIFGGGGYYDEGDSNGDGVADSGGALLDSPRDDKRQKDRELDREHITTRKLNELKRQKEAMDTLEKVHNDGVQIDWSSLPRNYEDYGNEGPYFYLQRTKEYATQFTSVKSREEL